MSEETAHRSETAQPRSVLALLERWYHVPALAALVAFMFWTRTLAYDRFVREDGAIALSGVDPWYHYRTSRYVLENFPQNMPYDVWTGYSYGAHVDQFGTVFDQLIVAAALVVGLGDPSAATFNAVFLLAPAAIGALVALPTYFIGKRLGGRFGGISAVALLALFSGTFLRRGLVGFTDHHIAEALFMAIGVLAYMVALRSAEVHKPVYEQVVDGDLRGLKTPLVHSLLAGFAVALFVWTWPPAVFFIGVLGAFFVVKLSADFLVGESPDHAAFVGVVSLVFAGLLMLPTTNVWSIAGSTTASLLQPVLAFGVAAGCAFLAWLAREWERRGLDAALYPAAVAGLGVVALGVAAVALPSLFNTLTHNLARIVPIGATDTTLTIREAQPPNDISQHMYGEYGLAFFTAMATLVFMAGEYVLGRRRRAEHLLVVVWALFMFSMAITQVRFNYYFAVTVAVLNAYLVGLAIQWADLSGGLSRARNLQGYQVMVLAVVALLLVGPLVPPVAASSVVDRSESNGPGGSAEQWRPATTWLSENTPAQGDLGGAGNEMDVYGTYGDDGTQNYDYPEGSYGVMSWWDYGHLITVQGERAPVANPFQQHARTASAFLLAQNETHANALLDAFPADPRAHTRSTDELQRTAAEYEGDERIRYVMIDDAMAGGKFSAIAQWTDPEGSYVERGEFTVGDNQTITVAGTGDRYENTMLSRLYFDNADGLEHYRLVHATEAETTFVSVAVREQGGADWQPLYVNRELTRQLQQQLMLLSANPNYEIAIYEQRTGPEVSTFERVPGATIEGEGAPPNSEVTAEVELEVGDTGRTFVYSQTVETDENGEFTMTVPYATTGEDELGPEDGYTNSAVRANGSYVVYAPAEVSDDGNVSQLGAEFDVSEPQVVGEDDSAVQVELEEREFELRSGDENGSAANDGAANETDDESTDDENASGGNDSEAENGSAATNDSGATETAAEEGENASSVAPPTPALASVATLGFATAGI